MANTVLVDTILAALQTKMNAFWAAKGYSGSPPTLTDDFGGFAAMFDSAINPLVAVADQDHTLANQKGGFRSIIHTTGSTQRTETIGSVTDNRETELVVMNANGSGSGGVKIATSGTKKFLYNGAEYTNLYLRKPGRAVRLRALYDAAGAAEIGWLIAGGEVSPVDNEPDIGGGLHRLSRAVPGALDISSAVYTFGSPGTWDLKSLLPNGSPSTENGIRLIELFGECYLNTTAQVDYFQGAAWNYDDGASSAYREVSRALWIDVSGKAATSPAIFTLADGIFPVSIGVSKKLYYGASSSGRTLGLMLRGYWLGPA